MMPSSNISSTMCSISHFWVYGYLYGLMLGGTLPGIRWISWSWFQVGGRPLEISSNTLECLSMIHWRCRGIDGLDVWTSSEHSYAIMPWCPFNNFVMPLELITLSGFPMIPLNSIYFPFNENFMKSSQNLKAPIVTIGFLVQHQHHPWV